MTGYLGLAKLIVGYAVGSSTSFTVKRVIASNINPQTTSEVIQAWIGSGAIAAMVGLHAKEYAEGSVDDAVEAVQKIKAIKAAKETSS